MNGIPSGIDPETKSRIQRILKMTGHPALDMLQHFIDEGVMEVVRIYSRNKKYKDLFPKFFPEFVEEEPKEKEPEVDLTEGERVAGYKVKILDLLRYFDEDRAMSVFHTLREAFGWGGTIFTRADAEGMAKRELTDDEWLKVVATASWKKGLQDRLTERGWREVEGALREVEIEPARCKKCNSNLYAETLLCVNFTCSYSDRKQDEEIKEETYCTYCGSNDTGPDACSDCKKAKGE